MLALEDFALAGRVGPVSGEFRAGRLTLLIGPNGSGKSSLLAGAAGLAEGEGRVRLAGRDLDAFDLFELSRHRAMLTQQVPLPQGLRGYELLALAAEPVGGVSEALCRSIAALAPELGLEPLYDRPLAALSGGEQQRLLIAKTVLQLDPKVNPDGALLLLDEPLAGLDWRHQLATLGLLRRCADGGLAVVASIHDINLACQFGDDIWCLHRGRLAARGGPEVVTPELIAEVFGVRVRLLEQDGARLLLPDTEAGC
jgi:ABC-type cobalamin transport system ATPase subunit